MKNRHELASEAADLHGAHLPSSWEALVKQQNSNTRLGLNRTGYGNEAAKHLQRTWSAEVTLRVAGPAEPVWTKRVRGAQQSRARAKAISIFVVRSEESDWNSWVSWTSCELCPPRSEAMLIRPGTDDAK
ncbi:hypothetical protein LTS18_001543, partial [Coniosporium uncinatum]